MQREGWREAKDAFRGDMGPQGGGLGNDGVGFGFYPGATEWLIRSEVIRSMLFARILAVMRRVA